jgi:hypothetical protein
VEKGDHLEDLGTERVNNITPILEKYEMPFTRGTNGRFLLIGYLTFPIPKRLDIS